MVIIIITFQVFLFLADQIFYISYVNRQHFHLQPCASLCKILCIFNPKIKNNFGFKSRASTIVVYQRVAVDDRINEIREFPIEHTEWLVICVRSLLLGYKLTLFFQIVPCRLNLPITLLLESFRPHRSVLMSLIVAASIFPVIGILPNL